MCPRLSTRKLSNWIPHSSCEGEWREEAGFGGSVFVKFVVEFIYATSQNVTTFTSELKKMSLFATRNEAKKMQQLQRAQEIEMEDQIHDKMREDDAKCP